MTRRRPYLPFRVLACTSAAAVLLTTAACSDEGGGSTASEVTASALAEKTPTAPPRLTPAGAQAALLTEDDLEGNWNQVKGAAAWGDTLLVGKVDVARFLTAKANAADCQRLLVDGHVVTEAEARLHAKEGH